MEYIPLVFNLELNTQYENLEYNIDNLHSESISIINNLKIYRAKLDLL